MQDKYRFQTIKEPVSAVFKDRGSRFIAFAFPVNNEREIRERIQGLKKEHPKAVHHCVAWRLGTDRLLFRANDDGEPSGSAGKPMLGQIDSQGLTNVLVVVVRYFGGTLLGVPGLIHAYKTVTADALREAVIIERWVEALYEIRFDYPVLDEVLRVLRQSDARIQEQEMQLWCIIHVAIPLFAEEACVEKLKDIRGVEIKKTEKS